MQKFIKFAKIYTCKSFYQKGQDCRLAESMFCIFGMKSSPASSSSDFLLFQKSNLSLWEKNISSSEEKRN